MSNYINPLEIAQTQFEKAADNLQLDQNIREFLKYPEQEFVATVPVRMDNGYTKNFTVFRIKHNSARGPTRGGTLFHPMLTSNINRAIAMWMTWKHAVVNIPRGGAYGGISVDLVDLSSGEIEELIRGMIRKLFPVIGEGVDILTSDFGIMNRPQMIGWIVDEYSRITRKYTPSIVTGKPIGQGGSLGSIESTGYGVAITIREAMKFLNINPRNSVASIQGFGNVAQHAASLFTAFGGKVVCVSCWDRNTQQSLSVSKEDGIDVRFLMLITDMFGSIDKDRALEAGYDVDDGEAWISKDVDVLIPAALENQISSFNVNKISDKVKIIAEGADNPITPEADEILKMNKIFIIPDLLCNAGGITVSYFEEIQSSAQHWWSKEVVLSELDRVMTDAFQALIETAEGYMINHRDAALLLAVSRVEKTMQFRGLV